MNNKNRKVVYIGIALLFGLLLSGGLFISCPRVSSAVYYKISYETEHGLKPRDLEGKLSGEAITEEELPVLSENGYEFLGWYKKGSDEEVKAGDVITSDLVLEAKWKALEYTITYSTAYGTKPEPVVAEYGTKIGKEKLPELTAEGYIFLGLVYRRK